MEKKDTALEVKKAPSNGRKKRSGAQSFKKRMNIFWLKIKSFFTGKKSAGKKKKAVKPNEVKVPFGKKLLVVSLNLLGMGALVFIVPYIALLWLDYYTNHGEEIQVPDVCGMTFDDAVNVLERRELTGHATEYIYCEGAVEGQILKQHPEPGSYVKEGRSISFKVNTTVKPRKAFPSVIDNLTYRAAESHIKAAGFVIERVETIDGELDWVYEVRYEGRSLSNGELVPEGSRITVFVGNGKASVEEDEPVFDSDYDI